MSKEAGMLTEMGRLLNDENNDITVAPFFGTLVGISGGVAFMIAVEGVGHGSTQEASYLQSQINGLERAKQELTGPGRQVKANQRNINQVIEHTRSEIQAVTPHSPSLVEVGGPLMGGAALGMFAFTAIAARIRIARRNRTTPTPASS